MEDVEITLLVVIDTYSQSNHLAPMEVRLKALEYMDLSAKIIAYLSDFMPACLAHELEYKGCRGVNTAESVYGN